MRLSGGAWSASPARTARAPRPAGWSTCSRGRAGSVGLRRRAAAGRACTGGVAATAALGQRTGVRRGGRRVRRQFRRLPPVDRDRHQRRMGPPRRVRGSRGRDPGVRGVAAAGDGGRAGADARRQRRRPGSRRARRAVSTAGPASSCRFALDDGRRQAGASARPDPAAPTTHGTTIEIAAADVGGPHARPPADGRPP